MTVPSSTTSSAGNVTLDPASSSTSWSTVSTSSGATFSCLPPQRTIAYTRELPLPCACPASLDFPAFGPSNPRRARHEPDMPSYAHETTTGDLFPGLSRQAAANSHTGSLAPRIPVPAGQADHRLPPGMRTTGSRRTGRPPAPARQATSARVTRVHAGDTPPPPHRAQIRLAHFPYGHFPTFRTAEWS